MDCPEAHPGVYLSGLHLICWLETPVVIFCFYCIAFESPRSMQKYKWLLLNQLVWVYMMQFVIGSLVQPMLLLPAAGVQANGLLNKFLSPFAQFYLAFFFVGVVLANTVSLFEYRHHILLPAGSPFKFRPSVRAFIYCIRTFVLGNFAFPLLLRLKDRDEDAVKLYWKQKVVCFPEKVFSAKSVTLFFDEEDFKYLIIIFCGCGVQGSTEATIYLLDSFRRLNPFSHSNYSDKTKKLQLSFLKSLCVQEILPLLVSFNLPSALFGYTIVTGSFNLDRNSLAMTLLVSHGLLSATLIILANKQYRGFLWNLLTGRRCFQFHSLYKTAGTTFVSTIT